MNTAVSQFEPLLPITPGQREVLLLKVNWDLESLKSSFQEYADTNLFLLENGICPKNIVSVINKSECGVCCSKGKVLGLRCRHMACLNCWNEFLGAKFKSGECVLGCMEFGCNMLISNEMLGRFLNNSKLLFSYQKVVIDSFVNNSSSLTWCIKKCGKAVRGSSGDTVTCSCGSKFCFTCKIDSHLPATCQQLKLFNQRQFDSDRKSSNWILYYTKECPKCFIPIQKNGGCNQMRCTACRYSFCWICSQTHYGEYSIEWSCSLSWPYVTVHMVRSI
ncbi:hypothetical protein CAEBREN_23161 [Caenorhabditis brenneri]|uniref:RBR-type E3 ubiquitin transferase n=1 Tax=Caenorhabditis brenneri TaxID=135651 RepID=G0MMJ0_CAEBE|nr:hypothetical protein CAEBREN_23161 [Caenorhabditis brenneri]